MICYASPTQATHISEDVHYTTICKNQKTKKIKSLIIESKEKNYQNILGTLGIMRTITEYPI